MITDTLIRRACAMFQLKYGVCEIRLSICDDYLVVDTQFHKFFKIYGRPFARVLYLFLMKDIDSRSVTPPLGVTRVTYIYTHCTLLLLLLLQQLCTHTLHHISYLLHTAVHV